MDAGPPEVPHFFSMNENQNRPRYGCRVVQKALETLDKVPELQVPLVNELNGHVLQLVVDTNANHVVQMCM